MYKVVLHRISNGESLILGSTPNLRFAEVWQHEWELMLSSRQPFGEGFAVYILPVDANRR